MPSWNYWLSLSYLTLIPLKDWVWNRTIWRDFFFSLKYFICRMVCKVYQTFNIMNKMLSYSSIKTNKENTTPMYQWTMLRLMFDSKVFWYWKGCMNFGKPLIRAVVLPLFILHNIFASYLMLWSTTWYMAKIMVLVFVWSSSFNMRGTTNCANYCICIP